LSALVALEEISFRGGVERKYDRSGRQNETEEFMASLENHWQTILV
jgi:hypothetical protein